MLVLTPSLTLTCSRSLFSWWEEKALKINPYQGNTFSCTWLWCWPPPSLWHRTPIAVVSCGTHDPTHLPRTACICSTFWYLRQNCLLFKIVHRFGQIIIFWALKSTETKSQWYGQIILFCVLRYKKNINSLAKLYYSAFKDKKKSHWFGQIILFCV